MKGRLPLIVLLFSCLSALGQNKNKSIYLQSKNLFAALNGNKIVLDGDLAEDLTELFSDAVTADDIANELNNNPFLKGKITFIAPNAQSAGTGRFNSLIKQAGSLDVTNFANALASLLIDRAKEELNLAFFNRLQQFSIKYPEFQTLFPTSYDRLRNLLNVDYPRMLPVLREAFFSDIEQLTYNLEAVLELPKYQALRNNFPEINMAIETLKLIHKLENGATPSEVIVDVDDAATNITRGDYWANASLGFKNLVTTVHFTRIFSESLQGDDVTKIWISLTDAKDLVKNENFTRLYLGLLWQKVVKMRELRYYKNKTDFTALQDLLASNSNSILLFQNKISQFLSLASQVQHNYNEIKGLAPGEKPGPEQYYNYINTSLDIIDFGLSIVKLLDKDLQPDDYLDIARQSNNLYKDIYSKQYTMAVNDGFEIIGSIHDLIKTKKDDVNDANVNIAFNEFSTFVSKAKPYVLFIGNVADAKSEEDIKAALNNAILPVGSSSIKKNSANNLSIQAYLGAYYSMHNDRSDAVRAWSDKFGVYGPIGIAYTPGVFSFGKGGALSLFASVFDLGAIIDYKLKKDSVITSTDPASSSSASKQYTVNLGQIFSPGLHLVYGFCYNVPLSLGIGAQYGPGLSKIDVAGTTNVINPSWRFNAFLAVDLPLFNVLNKTKDRK